MVEGCLAVSHQTIIDDGCNTEVTMRRLSLVVAIGALFVNCTTTTGGGPTDPGPGTTDQGTPDHGQTVPDSWVPGEETVANDVPSELGLNQMALYESGTRIKAKIGRTADGAKQWSGWYDSDLGTDCAFGRAPDGKSRCLPTMATNPGYFEDASCKKPILTTWVCYANVKWGSVCPQGSQCPSINPTDCQLHELGAKFTADSGYYLNPTDGTCNTADLKNLRVSYVTYSSGKQVSPSIFAEVTETIE
jgi:hypothetical protein